MRIKDFKAQFYLKDSSFSESPSIIIVHNTIHIPENVKGSNDIVVHYVTKIYFKE